MGARRRAEEELKDSVQKLAASLRGTVGAISSISEIRDPYTAGHQRRVGTLAAEIGRTLGLPEMAAEGLLVAGEVHDVGKIGVPIEILVLPRRLSVEEFGMVKRHARFGYEMLKSVEFPWPVADAVCHHHERLDGSGYPDGLEGDAISIAGSGSRFESQAMRPVPEIFSLGFRQRVKRTSVEVTRRLATLICIPVSLRFSRMPPLSGSKSR